MAIKFRCSSCGKKLGVEDQLAGRRGKCPDCGFLFTVPAPDAPSPPSPRVMRQDDTDYAVDIDGTDQDADPRGAGDSSTPARSSTLSPADPDLLFGRLALKAGLLSEEQVRWLVDEQARLATDGSRATLGEIAQSLRLLTSHQVQVLLLGQEFAVLRDEDRRLGSLAVRNGFASEEEVALALDEQKRAYQEERTLPKRLGEILVEMGTLSQQQIDSLLKAQARLAGRGATPASAAPSNVAPAPSPAETLPSTTASGEAVTGWLIQEAGEGAGTKYPMGARAILGRQPTNEVPLPEIRASRQHAKIEFIALAKQHVVADLNSRNGTSVNGEPLTEPRALQPGDRIQIGQTVLRYEAGAGVTPGFIPPGVTMAAPGAGMGSQIRRETVAMRAATPAAARIPAGERLPPTGDDVVAEVVPPKEARPARTIRMGSQLRRDTTALGAARSDGDAAPEEPTGHPTRAGALPSHDAGRRGSQESEAGRALRRAAALLRRRGVLAGGAVVLLIGMGTWMLANRGEGGNAPAVATGTESATAPGAPSVPQTPADASDPAGTLRTACATSPTTPPAPASDVATAPPQTAPHEADHDQDGDRGRASQREARAKIEQAKASIAGRDFDKAEALLQEALSLDPESEAEIVHLFEVADRGLNEGKTVAADTPEAPPSTPAPAAPNPPPDPKRPAPSKGEPPDGAAAPLLVVAQAHERNSKFDLAILKYREILADYPGTAAAATAKGRLAALRQSCRKCMGLGMKCPDCAGKGTKYTTCAMCNGAGKGAGSMQAGKAGGMQNGMCPRCNGSCKHDEMCRKCGGVGRVRCTVCWALPALEGSASSQRGKKEPELLDGWSQNLALMVTGRDGWTGPDYAALEKDLRAKRAGAGESPAAIADSLGAALMAQGKFKEASDCFAKSLSLRKEALGKDAPEVGDCFLEFGLLDAAQGKTAAALLNLDQAHLVYMTAWNAARNKEFFLLVWGAATENQPEGLAKDAMEVAQSEGRRQVKEEIDSIAARMERANLLRDLIETCELRWRFKGAGGTGEDAPPSASVGDEDKARALLGTAEQFEKNGMKDRAIERLNEIIAKYPDTESAAKAKERLADLQSAGGTGASDGGGKTTDGPPKGDSGAGHNATDRDKAEACPTCGGRGTVQCTSCTDGTDGKVTVECDACHGESLSACAAAWGEHMEAGKSAFGSQDFGGAEEELRAALRVAEAFGEHDVRFAESLIALGGVLKMLNQRSEGEAMVKRAKEIVEYLRQNGLSVQKKCAKCKGTGKITSACPDCKGKRVVPCPDCGGKYAGGGGSASDDERANSLLTVAQAFETNKKPDLAIQKYQEILSKYPGSEAAATAKKRLEELQAGAGSDK